jgi:hypothetical protein
MWLVLEQLVSSQGDVLYARAGGPLGGVSSNHDDKVGAFGALRALEEDHSGVAEGIAVGPDLVGYAGSFGQRLGQAVLKRRVRHEIEHLGRELRGGVGGIGDGLQHEEDVVWGRDVGDPVLCGSRAYSVQLGLYVSPSQVPVEHNPGGVVALLDHDLGALAQGHGVAHWVLVGVPVQHAGAVGLDVRGENGDLTFEVNLAAGSSLVEGKQNGQLGEAARQKAPVGVERDGLARGWVVDHYPVSAGVSCSYLLEPGPEEPGRELRGKLGRDGLGLHCGEIHAGYRIPFGREQKKYSQQAAKE